MIVSGLLALFLPAVLGVCPPPMNETNRFPGNASGEALLEAIEALRGHLTGLGPTLDQESIASASSAFSENAGMLTSTLHIMGGALDLVDEYEKSMGPAFLNEERFLKSQFSRVPLSEDEHEIDRAMMVVQQAILDELYHASLWGPHDQGADPVDWEYSPIVKQCESVLRGRKWELYAWLAGAPEDQPSMFPVEETVDYSAEHVVRVNASFPALWGRPVAFSGPEFGLSRRIRPLGGLYLVPGEVASIQVPDELVAAGYTIQVGSQVINTNRKDFYVRMDRMTSSFPISEPVTKVANPLGGELFLRSPYGTTAGLVDLTISGGVVQSASFFLTSLKTTSQQEWDLLRTTAPAPWVSLETDNYLSQVPRIWIYGYSHQHMTTLLTNYTNVMNAVSDIVGIPPDRRNNYIHYESLSRIGRAGAAGIGYPQCNYPVLGSPTGPQITMRYSDGMAQVWLVRDPMEGSIRHGARAVATSFHELGHAQKYAYSCYPGEKESIVHVPYTYARNVVYNESIDESFKLSISYQNPYTHIPNLSVDGAAIDWMVRDNFRLKNPMDTSFETRYNHIGHGKYADISRLLGWDVIKDFYHQEQLDYIATDGSPDYHPDLINYDSRTLRLSIAAGEDLTPLIHFWGVHPADELLLKQKMLEHNLLPSWKVKKQLLHYANIVPMTRQAFYEHWQAVWKPDEVRTCKNQCAWYRDMEPIWGETQASQAVDAVLYIIAKYWPANTCVDPALPAAGTTRRMGVRGKSHNQSNSHKQSSSRNLTTAGQQLVTAKAKWLSQKLSNYDFELEREFLGPDEEMGPFNVKVRKGQVVSAIYKQTQQQVDLDFIDIISIDDLFSLINEHLHKGKMKVTYNNTMGYPDELIFIDDVITFRRSLTAVDDQTIDEDDEDNDGLFMQIYVSNVVPATSIFSP